jgi:branched-chain amino acid transport system permease protein
VESVLSALVSIAFHGVAYAMVLYLISVGLSVTMGLMGFVNLAHGAFAMAGGYLALTLMSRAGVPFFGALALACVIVAFAGAVIERTLYARLYNAPELDQVLFSVSLIFMAVASAKFAWGPLALPVPLPDYLRGQVDLFGRAFPTYRSFLILSGGIIVLAVWLGLERTRFGAQIRAAVDNRRMAAAIGINTALLFTCTFAFGSGLAALGGALGADILAIDPTYAQEHLIFFLIVVSVGGLGSIRGPFFAALLLGVTDTACKYLIPEFGAFFIYAATLAVLMWRPNGLFGRAA